MKLGNDVRSGRGGEADALTPPAGRPPVAAEDHAPVPQRRRLGGLAAGSDDSALDRALDSINLSWLAEVSVAKSLAVPVGLVMGLGWLAGSFALTTGVLGIALFVAGFLTLLHAWLNHHDAPGDGDAGTAGLRGWLGSMLGFVADLEITTWALLAAAAGTWWFARAPEGTTFFVGIVVLALVADVVLAFRRDDA